MPRNSGYLLGLEIGVRYLRAVMADLDPVGRLRVLGVGEEDSEGCRKGDIVDVPKVEAGLRKVIAEAEQTSDLEARRIALCFSGDHVSGFTHVGSHPVLSSSHVITSEDIRLVTRNARTLSLPPESYVAHIVPQLFCLDGKTQVANPIGMLAKRLDLATLIVHANQHRVGTAVHLLKNMHLDVHRLVFKGIASASTVVTRDQEELGVLVIDLGAGTSDFAFLAQGKVKYAAAVGVGGDHVTNDLACALKVSFDEAEKLKLDYGRAGWSPSETDERVPLEVVDSERTASLKILRQVMTMRLEETFEVILSDLQKQGLESLIHAGVILCGGGSRVPHIEDLASRVFGRPARVARTLNLQGLDPEINRPEFASVLGAVKFAFAHPGKNKEGFGGKANSSFQIAAKWATSWLQRLKKKNQHDSNPS